jgi:hypothetical protein
MTRQTKGKRSASSIARPTTSERSMAASPQHVYTTTPDVRMSKYPSPFPTPVTPTRRRGIAKALVPSSSLSSLPATPVQRLHPNSHTSPICRASFPDDTSRVLVPPSETQALEINPFLSNSPKHAHHEDARFKKPALPLHPMLLPSVSLSILNPDYQDEELYVVPSSQTQDLVPTVSPARLRQRHIFDVRLRANEEIIPDSQLTDPDLLNTPSHTPGCDRQPSISPSRRRATISSTSSSAKCPGREFTQCEIVPTSQSAEKEITSSDYFGMTARTAKAGDVPTDVKQTGYEFCLSQNTQSIDCFSV